MALFVGVIAGSQVGLPETLALEHLSEQQVLKLPRREFGQSRVVNDAPEVDFVPAANPEVCCRQSSANTQCGGMHQAGTEKGVVELLLMIDCAKGRRPVDRAVAQVIEPGHLVEQ